MGLLQDGETDGDIVGSFEVFSILVPQIFFLYIEEKFGIECSEVAGDKGVLSIVVVCDDSLGEGPRVSSCSCHRCQKVGVHEVQSFLLKVGIEQFEHLSSDEFVIAVDDHEDVIGFAVVVGGEAQVVHGSHLLLISDYFVSFLWDFVLG